MIRWEGMRSSRDEQHSIEQGYARLIHKVFRDMASRRAKRVALRACVAGWRGRVENKHPEVRAQVRKAFHCLVRGTTKRMQSVLREWSWLVGQRRNAEKRASIFLRQVLGCRSAAPVELRLLSSTRSLFDHLSAWRRESEAQRIFLPLYITRFLVRSKMHRVMASWRAATAADAAFVAEAYRRKESVGGRKRLVLALHAWTNVSHAVRKARTVVSKLKGESAATLQRRAFAAMRLQAGQHKRVRLSVGRFLLSKNR